MYETTWAKPKGKFNTHVLPSMDHDAVTRYEISLTMADYVLRLQFFSADEVRQFGKAISDQIDVLAVQP